MARKLKTIDRPLVIDVKDVTKDFTTHVAKSIKERIVTIFKLRGAGRTRFRALDDITLQIRQGESVGLMGHNGSGKSTLLKIIGGIIEASQGSVAYRGRLAALLELGAGFHPDLTGRENIYLNAAVLGLTKQGTDAVFDDIVTFSGLSTGFIDTQVKFYSSGMYVRLAFAVAVHSDPDILLVDEVLAVGDERFQAKCLAKIREFQAQGKTIVLVSHSAEQVADVCSRTVVLDRGRMIFDGDAAEGIRALRDSYEQSRHREAADSEGEGHEGDRAAVEIVGVDVLDSDGKIIKYVETGQDITVRVKAQVTTATEWVTGFTMYNSSGQFVYLLNTIGLGLGLPEAPGEYDVDFHLRSVNFGSTRLVVSAGATTPNGIPLSNMNYAAEIDAAPDGFGSGFLKFAVSGDVTPVAMADRG